MSSKGLATIIRSDFCRASKVSKGDGVLRCVVVDGMSFLQNTETLVKTAINIVDKRYASVLSVTFVVIDRQFDPAVRLETEKRGGDPAALLDFVSEYAAFKKLKTHVLAKRLYSSIKNTRMFWALFLFVPQQVCEADEADVVGRSRSAVQATTSRLQVSRIVFPAPPAKSLFIFMLMLGVFFDVTFSCHLPLLFTERCGFGD